MTRKQADAATRLMVDRENEDPKPRPVDDAKFGRFGALVCLLLVVLAAAAFLNRDQKSIQDQMIRRKALIEACFSGGLSESSKRYFDCAQFHTIMQEK